MAIPLSCIFSLHFFLLLFIPSSADMASLGINYGQVGDDLPPPESVVGLLSSLNFKKTRIYDTNPLVLAAFANSSIELMVTVENAMLSSLKDPHQALQWVSSRISPYVPYTMITGIAVGNEVYKGDGDTTLLSNLVPAMTSIHSALAQLGLDNQIKVSTPHSLSVLAQSYPPSAGAFREEIVVHISKQLQFLASTGSPFWINAYPYFAYNTDPARISLDYALLNPSSGMVDPNSKLHYDNMLYAQVDAVRFAIYRLGFRGVGVSVSETGWPSKGDEGEVGATLENARVYNRNLVRKQEKGEGTPLMPKPRLEVFLFALFNEDLKPGPASERNFGLYQPDESMVYNVGLTALSTKNSGFTFPNFLPFSSAKGGGAMDHHVIQISVAIWLLYMF